MTDIHETCRVLKEQLSEFLDGQLESEVCAEIERHIRDCDNCRVIVDTLSKTITLYHEYGRAEVPDEVHRRLTRVLDLERLKSDQGSKT